MTGEILAASGIPIISTIMFTLLVAYIVYDGITQKYYFGSSLLAKSLFKCSVFVIMMLTFLFLVDTNYRMVIKSLTYIDPWSSK